MPSFWQRVSSELHTIFGLLDDMGDISSALVITIATIKVAVAFVQRRARRASASRPLSHPRRQRRRSPRVANRPTAVAAQQCASSAHPPGRHKAA